MSKENNKPETGCARGQVDAIVMPELPDQCLGKRYLLNDCRKMYVIAHHTVGRGHTVILSNVSPATYWANWDMEHKKTEKHQWKTFRSMVISEA